MNKFCIFSLFASILYSHVFEIKNINIRLKINLNLKKIFKLITFFYFLNLKYYEAILNLLIFYKHYNIMKKTLI